jgi:nitroreductase
MLIAAAMGWAACSITGWLDYDAGVAPALGLGPEERITGLVHIGTVKENRSNAGGPTLP